VTVLEQLLPTVRRHRDSRTRPPRWRGNNNEGVLLLVTLAMLSAIMVVDPGAVSASLAGDIVRAAMDNMALALGVLLILLSGGIDVSFTAIAIFGGYATVTFMLDHHLDGGLWPFVAATMIGSLLGLGNALLVAGFRLQTLIATLAMQSIVWGVLAGLRRLHLSLDAAKQGWRRPDSRSCFDWGTVPSAPWLSLSH